MNNHVYTYTVEQCLGSVTAKIYRNGEYVDSELFQLGRLEYLFNRATKWSETRIELMKKYEVKEKKL